MKVLILFVVIITFVHQSKPFGILEPDETKNEFRVDNARQHTVGNIDNFWLMKDSGKFLKIYFFGLKIIKLV